MKTIRIDDETYKKLKNMNGEQEFQQISKHFSRERKARIKRQHKEILWGLNRKVARTLGEINHRLKK